jgi:hypothetical protein
MQGAQNKRPPMKKEVTPKTQGAQYKRPPIKKEATSHEGDSTNRKSKTVSSPKPASLN